MITSPITNTPIVAAALKDYYAAAGYYDKCLRDIEKYQLTVEVTKAEVLRLVKDHGGYQLDGMVAYTEERVSYAAQVELVRANVPDKLAEAVIVESVNEQALAGLLKGKLITDEQYAACRTETKRVPAFVCPVPKAK